MQGDMPTFNKTRLFELEEAENTRAFQQDLNQCEEITPGQWNYLKCQCHCFRAICTGK